MKLSFSTNHWGENSLNRCLDIAVTYGFSGVELHSLDDLGGETPAAVYHRLIALGLKIPCVDLCADVGIAAQKDEALAELKRVIPAMQRLRVAYLRLRAAANDGAVAAAEDFLRQAVPLAERGHPAHGVRRNRLPWASGVTGGLRRAGCIYVPGGWI